MADPQHSQPFANNVPIHQPAPHHPRPALASPLLLRGLSSSPPLAVDGTGDATSPPLSSSLPTGTASSTPTSESPSLAQPHAQRSLSITSIYPNGRPHSASVPSSPQPSEKQHGPPLHPPHRHRSPRPERHSRPVRLYYSPEFASVAHEIRAISGGKIELCDIDWKRFADGWPNLVIHQSNELKWYHCGLLASFHSPEVFFEQISVALSIPKLLPKSFKLLLPFFPTGTMERVSKPGEVATASTLARLLSTLPATAKGPPQLSVHDIHALGTQFYFRDSVLIRLNSAIPLLLNRLLVHPDYSNNSMQIVFPDEGAMKRFSDQFTNYFHDPVICGKVREGAQRIVKIKEGNAAGKHCVIIDDLAQSGGTLLECAKQLLNNGATAVSCFVTHVIFPNNAETKFINNPAIKHFWMTDSNPVVAQRCREAGDPFEVITLAPSLLDVLLDDTA